MPFIGRNIRVLVISRLSWATRETEGSCGRQGGHVDNTRGRRDDRKQEEAGAVFPVISHPIASSPPLRLFASLARDRRAATGLTTLSAPLAAHQVHPAARAARLRRQP